MVCFDIRLAKNGRLDVRCFDDPRASFHFVGDQLLERELSVVFHGALQLYWR
jgi:hypothetical protein